MQTTRPGESGETVQTVLNDQAKSRTIFLLNLEKDMDIDTLLMLYRRMFLIRNVEERIKAEYSNRNIRMAVHLSIGQEAVATGVLMATRPTDCCLSTHRCHAHYLGKGGNLQEMVDELFSLETGCSRGYGGSMHLFDKKVNMWGSGAIVGGSIPVAVGMGLALKQARTDDLCVSFMGDGGADEGPFFESLNLAALLNVPVLFVLENNHYSTITPQNRRQAALDTVAKSQALGVEAVSLDGNDVVQVYETCHQVLDHIRASQRPFLIEAVTYRLCAHVGPGSDFGNGRRSEAELAKWLPHEPLGALESRIKQEHLDGAERMSVVQAQVLGEIDAAFESAKRRFDELNARIGLVAPKPPDPSRV